MKEPKIRFKEFEGEWEETTFGKISTNYKYGINAAAIPFDGTNKYLRITDIDEESRMFSQRDLTSPSANLSLCNDYLLEDGDITIARTGASVGKSYIYHEKDGKVYFAGFLIRIRFNKYIDKDCVYNITLTDNYSKHIRLVSQRSGQPGVNINELKDFRFFLPVDFPEQQSIATFFTSLDEQINAAGERVASLKRVKAASLQAMFPQEGETTPRLRFKGFTADWQKATLGELFKERTERNSNGEMLSVTMNNGIIKASENGRFDNSSEDKSNYKVVKIGDIAYNSMRMWQGASGCSQYEGIVSPAYTVVVPNENICSAFFAYYFKTTDVIKIFRLHSQGLTKDTWNLKYPVFSLIDLYFPNNPIEQQKIADYFTNLDRQIALQEQRLEKLKQIKAACLDKMFV